MHFRIATTDDIEQIYAVMVSTGFISAFYQDLSKQQVIEILLENNFKSDKKITCVVAVADAIIGYSLFGPYERYIKKGYPVFDNYAFSRGTGVAKQCQNRGIGKKLRLATDEVAKDLGYSGMITDVSSDNKPSIAVQLKSGFTLLGEVTDSTRRTGISLLFKKEF